jgi:hypothetical protein
MTLTDVAPDPMSHMKKKGFQKLGNFVDFKGWEVVKSPQNGDCRQSLKQVLIQLGDMSSGGALDVICLNAHKTLASQ